MIIQAILTPWESKRLIAKAVVKHALVRDAMANGIVAVARGTTQAYVLEELKGEPVEKERYVAGIVTQNRLCTVINQLPEVAFRKGVIEEIPTNKIIEEMGPKDVFIKGGNALAADFNKNIFHVGVFLGSHFGGTIGASIGHIRARGINLMLPIGLEKMIGPPPVIEIASGVAGVSKPDYSIGQPIGVFGPLHGVVITEIQALQSYGDVQVIPLGAGGSYNAEGAIILQVEGASDEIKKIKELIISIKGEAPINFERVIGPCKECQITCRWQGKAKSY